jgi:hypothetical protein
MRRLALTTAVAVGIFALGCTDERQEGPTEPSSVASSAKLCPSTDPIQSEICGLFRPTDNLASASDFYNNIKTKKGQNRTADAQARAIDLINFAFKLYYQGKLLDPPGTPNTPQGVVTLTCDVLAFVSTAGSPTSCGDLGTTGLTPGSPHSTIQICGPAGCLVQPPDKHSGVNIPSGACPTPCIISIDPLPVNHASPRDGPLSALTNLDQYPLFREFKLSAAFTVFAKPVLVGICHLSVADGGDFAPPDAATEARLQLAHPDPNNSEGIEILAKVNAPFLSCADLLASNDEFAEPIGSTGRFSHLWGLASAAQGMLGRAMGPVLETLLPDRAEAAVLGQCCLGGATTKFSPWAAVDPESGDHLSFTEDPSSNNTSTGNYFKGVTLDTCGDGCFPAVQILDPDETVVGTGNVTVSLIQTEGTGGALNGTLTQPINSGEAVFGDLTISAPGTYKLKFTAPGAALITSAAFKVYTMAFTVQPTATAGGTVTENDFLGQPVTGFDNPVVQVSIVDFNNAVVTTANDQIEMAVTSGSLNGTTSVDANSGVANFTEINASPIFQQGLKVGVEADENNVSLQASANAFDTNPVQATSTTFNVTNVSIILLQ